MTIYYKKSYIQGHNSKLFIMFSSQYNNKVIYNMNNEILEYEFDFKKYANRWNQFE